jgi:hypothetical protein
MLEQWEKKMPFLVKDTTAPAKADRPAKSAAKPKEEVLDINTPPKEIIREENDYTKLFD